MNSFQDEFDCEKCGACCTQLHKSSVYGELDRGDGICKYFDEKGRSCLIYKNRPVICNINEFYTLYYAEKLSLKEFHELNKKACIQLRGRR